MRSALPQTYARRPAFGSGRGSNTGPSTGSSRATPLSNPATKSLPEIHQAPLAEIQQRFCRSTCYAQAFYRPGEGVYIDEAFDLANDEFARSVLLHELVHPVQRVSGAFQKMPSERARGEGAERAAAAIQNR